MSVGLEITGSLQGFNAAMSGFVDEFPDTISGALKTVAERVIDTATVLVPVKTGFLKSTLGYRQDSPLQVTFFATAPYAPYVEFGTRRMSAKLFLTRSIEQHIAEFPQQVKSMLAQLRDQFFIT
jgi:hypothetical protein